MSVEQDNPNNGQRMPPQQPNLFKFLENMFVGCAGGWNVQVTVEQTIDEQGTRIPRPVTPAQLVQNAIEALNRNTARDMEEAYNDGYEDCQEELEEDMEEESRHGRGGSKRGKNARKQPQ